MRAIMLAMSPRECSPPARSVPHSALTPMGVEEVDADVPVRRLGWCLRICGGGVVYQYGGSVKGGGAGGKVQVKRGQATVEEKVSARSTYIVRSSR